MQTIKLTPYENTLIGRYVPGSEVVVLLDTSAAGFTLTLPDALSSQGTKFTILTIGANNATIKPIAGQFINDETEIALAQFESISAIAFDGKHHIVDRYMKKIVFF